MSDGAWSEVHGPPGWPQGYDRPCPPGWPQGYEVAVDGTERALGRLLLACVRHGCVLSGRPIIFRPARELPARRISVTWAVSVPDEAALEGLRAEARAFVLRLLPRVAVQGSERP